MARSASFGSVLGTHRQNGLYFDVEIRSEESRG